LALAVAAIAGLATAPATPALATKPPGVGGAPACDAPVVRPDAETALVRMVNRKRAAAGLERLTRHGMLRGAARSHSRTMARKGVFAHSSTLEWAKGRPAGENLAEAPSPHHAMTAMVLSPDHLRNLLDPGWRWIGVGAADNCAGAQLYTVNLMGPAPTA
jgi:uncharacterized protein YkwD